MNAIVTGASGFVGSHLAERLLAEGFDVTCLLRTNSDPKWIGALPVRRITPAPGNPDALAAAVRGADYIFHVAGLTRGRSAAEYMAANAEPTRAIVDAAVRAGATLHRFVYVSSLAAVGPNRDERPQDESTPPRPTDDYGRSKLAGERFVAEAAAAGLPAAIVRPPGVYGPRDTNFLPMFRLGRRLGLFTTIRGGAKQVSLVHVDDLVEGIWLAATATPSYPSPSGSGSKGEAQTYFIASGTHTMAELGDAMSAALDRPLRRVTAPRWLARLAGEWGQLKWALTGRTQIMSRRKVRDLLQPRWTCAWSKAANELGYRERVPLADGLRQTARWYAEQGWV